MPTEPAHWIMEKKVNVAFIAAMILQTLVLVAAGATYAARVDARLVALEITDTRILVERDARRLLIDGRIDFLIKDRDRLVRVETQMENAARSLSRIEQKLDRETQR